MPALSRLIVALVALASLAFPRLALGAPLDPDEAARDRACAALPLLRRRLDADVFERLDRACQDPLKYRLDQETLGRAFSNLLNPPDPASGILLALRRGRPEADPRLSGDLQSCKALVDKLPGEIALPGDIPACLKRPGAAAPPALKEGETLVTIRVHPRDEVRVLTEARELPVRTLEILEGRVALAIVPTRTPTLVFVRRRGLPGGRPEPLSSWETYHLLPVAQAEPMELRPRISCLTLEVRGAPRSHVFVDGVQVSSFATDQGGARRRIENLPMSEGSHEVALLDPIKPALFRPIRVRAATGGGGAERTKVQCTTETIDLTRSQSVALVQLDVRGACADIGLDPAAVVRAAGEYINERFKGPVFHDSRHVATVLQALGHVDRDLAPADRAGPFSWNRPIEEAAKSLYGSGIADAIALSVDCARAGQSMSVTLTAVRVNTEKAWEDRPASDFIQEGSFTVSSRDDFLPLVQVPLSRIFGWPHIQLRPPFRMSYHSPNKAFNAVVHRSGKDVCSGKPCVITVWYERDDGQRCDAVLGRRRLTLTGKARVRAREDGRMAWKALDEDAEVRLPIAFQGPGIYRVAVMLQSMDGKALHAHDEQCVTVAEPASWIRFDAGVSYRAWAPEIAPAPLRGTIEATWLPQPEQFALTMGASIGYAFTSTRMSVPPTWDDITATSDLYRQGSLSLYWQRHSILAGPVVQFRLEPGRHISPAAGSGFHAFLEASPKIDLGFIYLRGVPESLTSFRGGSSPMLIDLDVNVELKLAIAGARFKADHELDLLLLMQFLALDDWLDTTDRSVTWSPGLAVGAGAALGFGL